MRVGPLRHRLVIQSADEAQDAAGQEIPDDFSTVATRWGEIRPMRGDERAQAQQVQADVTHKIIIRYFEGLTPKHRIKFGSRTFYILSVLNIDERNRMMEIHAKESV